MSFGSFAAKFIFLIIVRNISESRLAFRQAVSDPERYRQDDSRGVSAVWGLAKSIIFIPP